MRRFGRPWLLACLHWWQWFYDYSRGTLRAVWRRLFWNWSNYRNRLRILAGATTIVRDVHGTRFVAYPFDRPNLVNLVRRTFDTVEFQALRGLVHQGDVVFDVGANVGIYSVFLSRLCGPTGRVWAFEPVPDTYWRLQETLALNRCENVTAVRTAVSDKTGNARINLFDPRFAEWNSLGKPSMDAGQGTLSTSHQSVEVQTYRLDDFCREQGIERISFLKVDVEGFELHVFRGAERLLRERRLDYICFEISQAPLRGAGIKSREVFSELEAHGYIAYSFHMGTKTFRGPITDSSEAWTNFFASWKDLARPAISARERVHEAHS
jgi:FkbM family methyltransferase